jgi:hypothetical protein
MDLGPAANLLIRAGFPAECIEEYASPEAWLTARNAGQLRGSLGASDIPNLHKDLEGRSLGWATEWKVYQALKYGEKSDIDPRLAAQGRLAEPHAIGLYTLETGAKVYGCTERPIILRHPLHPWATCSPDAVATDGERIWLVEVKTDRKTDSYGYEGEVSCADYQGQLRNGYVVQAAWQSFVSGLPVAIVWLAPWYDVKMWWYAHRPNEGEHLRAHARAWLDRYIVGDDIPPADGSPACRDWIARRWPIGEEPREATPDEARLLHQMAECKAVEDAGSAANARRKELETRVLFTAGPAAALTVGSVSYGITRGKRGTFIRLPKGKE